jgi:hypothetical protein
MRRARLSLRIWRNDGRNGMVSEKAMLARRRIFVRGVFEVHRVESEGGDISAERKPARGLFGWDWMRWTS